MTTPTLSDLIVDNSDEHWKALDYVREWCQISESIDIATGHFELGAFLALDGEWQKVDKIRLLIGGETSRQTADAIAAALDRSIEVERADGDPLLTGAPAVVQAIRDGKIEIRTYREKKFHAKAYITHGRLSVVGSAALVGSSNFTKPGLTQNVELNVRFGGVEVRELQTWYDQHWEDSIPVEAELLKVLDHNVREFTPFEVWMKSLQTLTQSVDTPDREWETSESKIYPTLAPYQQEAFHGLLSMAQAWKGGFLTDGVGLGKTFVGLMLTEYYAVRKHQNVLILATKTAEDAVWRKELQERLPSLDGEFTNVRIMAHTDFQRKDAAERVERLKDRVDVVIIDEAHNFRNHGPTDSRWWKVQELCEGKTVFLLTATPINNSLLDFAHQTELFTGMQEGYFASLGISGLTAYLSGVERAFFRARFEAAISGAPVDLTDFDDLLRQDKLLQAIVWQNTRKYAKESSKAAGGPDVLFPEQQRPEVVSYSLSGHYGRLMDEIESAFQRSAPLFALPMYYPLAFSRDPDVDTRAQNRQQQVVALIRTIFLKRFESSIAAFAGSCLDLTTKVLDWLSMNSAGDEAAEERLQTWMGTYGDLRKRVHDQFRPTREFADIVDVSDLTAEELDELELALDPAEYKLDEMRNSAFDDLDQLRIFLELSLVAEGGDDKYDHLRTLIDPAQPLGAEPVFDPLFREQKVLIFTEFADTARYLHERLVADGIADVDRLDGSRTADRVAMIERFAPVYNRVSPADRAKQAPLRVLITTDVLAEGVNLQDGTLLVNYDLHWNPVRLIQRIGRVDRRRSQVQEDEITGRVEARVNERKEIRIRNFLPPDDIERLLALHGRVEGKILLISKTLGIPGGKLLHADDMLDDVKVLQAFKDEYEGELSPLEQLRLEYQELIAADPGLADRIEALPRGIGTGKSCSEKGVFACREVPTHVKTEDGPGYWTLDRPQVVWVLDRDGEQTEGVTEIADLIRSDATIALVGPTAAVAQALRAAEREQAKRYRKDVQLPLDAPAPRTVAWMELR
ncbi:helicase-related protein [Microbacterium flavum]|uniref:DEAD/DEAH box helicase family protein n=1 Tax=Microbacterium flavum TaxID=415216 RepID=A0ABS5XSH8_9MICO|nr:helicase-related protein [Microbacterium flavum]MBT8797479.1 DEAD/DEAH box helicase family protein [Microbacterium flavum]